MVGRLQRFLLPCLAMPRAVCVSVPFPAPSYLDSIQLFFLPGNHNSTALLNLFLFLWCLLAEVSVHAVATIKVAKFTCCKVPPPTPQPCPLDFSMPTVFLSPTLITSHLVTPFSNIDKQERERERGGEAEILLFHLGVGVR